MTRDIDAHTTMYWEMVKFNLLALDDPDAIEAEIEALVKTWAPTFTMEPAELRLRLFTLVRVGLLEDRIALRGRRH